MPWIIAILGLGALAVLLVPKYVEQKGQQALREMGIGEAALKVMYDAQREASLRMALALAQTKRLPPDPAASSQQLDAASQANQLAANRTAEIAEAVDRFVKSGRTHRALDGVRDEIANMSRLVVQREEYIDTLRKSSALPSPATPQPPRATKPSRSPRER